MQTSNSESLIVNVGRLGDSVQIGSDGVANGQFQRLVYDRTVGNVGRVVLQRLENLSPSQHVVVLLEVDGQSSAFRVFGGQSEAAIADLFNSAAVQANVEQTGYGLAIARSVEDHEAIAVVFVELDLQRNVVHLVGHGDAHLGSKASRCAEHHDERRCRFADFCSSVARVALLIRVLFSPTDPVIRSEALL